MDRGMPIWVEGMCKLHTYYITNSKKKLPYYSVNTSENFFFFPVDFASSFIIKL